MADNYLERHRAEYEQKKAEWLRRKRHLPKAKARPSIAKEHPME